MRDYYDVLGVAPDANADEIKRAYRQLARRYHPDISGDDLTAAFLEVSRAYEVLNSPERRSAYDVSRRRPRRAPSAARTEWFADEVAIDFPSVSSLLDRMRDAFFGAAPFVSLSAEIVLTREEAFWGATVPLGVPVRRTCPRCGGRGETWQEWCAACSGGGEVTAPHQVQLRVPAGVQPGERFRFSVMSAQAPPTVVEIRISVR